MYALEAFQLASAQSSNEEPFALALELACCYVCPAKPVSTISLPRTQAVEKKPKLLQGICASVRRASERQDELERSGEFLSMQ